MPAANLGTQVDRRAFFRRASRGAVPAADASVNAAASPLTNPRIRLAHLLRRAGFGATKAELDRYQTLGYEASVAQLLDYEGIIDPAEGRVTVAAFDLNSRENLKRWWMMRMRYTTRPLQEKLTFFLHGLLTSALTRAKPAAMLQQNELYRKQGGGSYRELLENVSNDAAMLRWLDGHNSKRQHPNENYARELMELFTIGIGHYTEADVQEAARALTGWRADRYTFQVTFRDRSYDSGLKTFMGQSGRFSGSQIIDIILEQRAAAEFLARTLWSYFAYPGPEPEVVGALADTLVATKYDLKSALRHIFLSDAFSSQRAYLSIVKSPVDLVISTYRLLGLEVDPKPLAYYPRIMGQDIFNPPNVAGWPGGPTWLSSALWLQRANFANTIATKRRGATGTVIDLPALTEKLGITTLAGLRDYFVELLLDGQLGDERLAVVNDYLGSDGGAFNKALLNRKGSGLLYLLLASPEYQLM